MISLLDRISIDPNACFGKPCIKGTRIWVSLTIDFLASGETTEQILDAYPQLTAEDVRAVIAYGADELRKRRRASARSLSRHAAVLTSYSK